jgi:hypothetical protein
MCTHTHTFISREEENVSKKENIKMRNAGTYCDPPGRAHQNRNQNKTSLETFQRRRTNVKIGCEYFILGHKAECLRKLQYFLLE